MATLGPSLKTMPLPPSPMMFSLLNPLVTASSSLRVYHTFQSPRSNLFTHLNSQLPHSKPEFFGNFAIFLMVDKIRISFGKWVKWYFTNFREWIYPFILKSKWSLYTDKPHRPHRRSAQFSLKSIIIIFFFFLG